MEYRRDVIGERFYASRNYNSPRHTYEAPGASRAQVDWSLTLRQARKALPAKGPASAPNLRAVELAEAREREPLTKEHPEGPYERDTTTHGKFQNMGNTSHLIKGLASRSCSSRSMDWHLNLRGGLHRSECKLPEKDESKTLWRRHCARPQQSFDLLQENCNATNELYATSQITPQDRRPDRRYGALPIETIRDEPSSHFQEKTPGSRTTCKKRPGSPGWGAVWPSTKADTSMAGRSGWLSEVASQRR